jgi:predicted nucleotidyltransferase
MTVAMAATPQATLAPGLAERERVLRVLRRHEAELRALGVNHLSLLGSMARGEARPESDVDVLLDVPPGRKFSLFDLGEVRVTLCEPLGRDADAVIHEDLRPEFRDRIARDLVDVF